MVRERVADLIGHWKLAPALSTAWCASCVFLATSLTVFGQQPDRGGLREPVYRVASPDSQSAQPKAVNSSGIANDRLAAKTAGDTRRLLADAPGPQSIPEHPLDPAIRRARDILQHIENNVRDYSCVLVKRERVDGELSEHEFMNCRIRHASTTGEEAVPFSVYLGFLKPDSIKGREVIYVDGQNNSKMIAHEGGFRGRFLPTVQLVPSSALAMRGNRYPITEIGIMTLTRRLIEKGERDRKLGLCEVRMVDGAKVQGRVCTLLEVIHPQNDQNYEFHKARIFVDNELQVPIRYEAYGFPTANETPPLLEEYTYVDMKLNVGLDDSVFDSKNPKYRF